ncbi:UNVERIFIED_CONTAM: hypothetical protein Cloal_2906 [Acetivibrio alkalicellulosi]
MKNRLYKMLKLSKYHMFISLMIIFILFTGYVLLKYIMSPSEPRIVNQISLTTEYEHKFIIIERNVNFPRDRYFIEVYHDQIKEKNYITKITKEENQTIDIISIYKSDNMNCYLLLDVLIYKDDKEDKFKRISTKSFTYIDDVEEYSNFIPVAKHLISNNEWKWVKVFGEFLVKAEDEYTIELLKRYSKGEFYPYELTDNEDSLYTKEEIQNYSKNVLKKHSIR